MRKRALYRFEIKSAVYKKHLDLLSHVCAALPWLKDFSANIVTCGKR